ncbi:MAG: preprotein translocase subunit SecG [Treponema sp.]|nr:preprotein translocase subunit SecG [Treponema sp.]MBP5748158.1 preprotein translocase subunit SecG [Treponema sp.]MBR4385721.1 preprotein translocase subunit SecG [Treponema sp.]
MGVVGTILLVAFVIVCVLLVLMVLVQNEDSNGMGSPFGGQSAAFGSHSASVLTKTTGVFVALFLVLVFSLALINKAPNDGGSMSATAKEVQGTSEVPENNAGSWLDDVKEEPKAEVKPAEGSASATEVSAGTAAEESAAQ